MKARPAPKESQATFLYPDLIDQLNSRDSLLQLAAKIPWERLEAEFAPLYAACGRPAKPVRLMVGVLLLKQLANLSDERVVEEWRQNPYFQAFCGMKAFQWQLPCEPSDFCHFRKRIGEKGMEKIFGISVETHGGKALESEIVVDTTVQEKNTTFPTDAKLRAKAIARCWKIAKKEQLTLRRSYRREVRKLLRVIRFNRNKNAKLRKSAMSRLKTIANALLNDISRKLMPQAKEALAFELEVCSRAANQKRADKNKIYSLREPEVFCIAKGKEHKKREFGNKAAFTQTMTDGIIAGARNAFNEHDSKCLAPLLGQIESITGKRPERAFCDRGFQGKRDIGGTKIEIPDTPKKDTTTRDKRKTQAKFRRRSAIEAIISHVKHDFRMLRNYLKGTAGDAINLLVAAAAFNFKKWMRATALTFFVMRFIQSFARKLRPGVGTNTLTAA